MGSGRKLGDLDPTPMISIRRECPEDIAAIRVVNEVAFEESAEADIVDALRDVCADLLSLVAESDGEMVGHILFRIRHLVRHIAFVVVERDFDGVAGIKPFLDEGLPLGRRVHAGIAGHGQQR